MILSGMIQTMPVGAEEILSLGELPISEYLQQLHGQFVTAQFYTRENPYGKEVPLEDTPELELKGLLTASLNVDEKDALEPEVVKIGSYNLLEYVENLLDTETYGFLVIEKGDTEIHLEEFVKPPRVVGQANDGNLKIGSEIADILYEIATNAQVLYTDQEYRVVVWPEGIRYYEIKNAQFKRIHGDIPKDLADRLARSNQYTWAITKA
jgi:hypothetical protein